MGGHVVFSRNRADYPAQIVRLLIDSAEFSPYRDRLLKERREACQQTNPQPDRSPVGAAPAAMERGRHATPKPAPPEIAASQRLQQTNRSPIEAL